LKFGLNKKIIGFEKTVWICCDDSPYSGSRSNPEVYLKFGLNKKIIGFEKTVWICCNDSPYSGSRSNPSKNQHELHEFALIVSYK
jgi:hypothetical protein